MVLADIPQRGSIDTGNLLLGQLTVNRRACPAADIG
jgi:hypothetical protein